MKRKTLSDFLTPFYISAFIQSACKLITPFYIIYFFSIGLDFWQIALISSLRSVVGLVCEIPTGAIADLYGKKFSVLLGYILSAITLFLIPLTDNFIRLAIIFCCNAFFETFFTGADNAWVSDRIEKENPSKMKVFFLRKRSIGNLGFIIAGLLGGITVKYLGMEYLWYGYGIGMIISTIILLLFAPDGNKGYEEEGEYLFTKASWQHIKKSFVYLMQHKVLWLLFGAMGLFLIIDELVGLIFTPYMEALGFPLENLGYLASLIGGMGIIFPLLIEKVLHKRKNPALVLGSVVGVFALFLLIVGMYSSLLTIVIAYFLYSIIDTIIFPIDTMLANSMIEPKKRATMISIKSVIENLASIIGAPLMGYVLGYISFSQGICFAGILMLIMGVVYVVIGKKIPILDRD